MAKRKKKPSKPSRRRRGLTPRPPTDKPVSSHTPAGLISSEMRFFQGPIPDPQTLQGYQQIDPDFPKRILAMGEAQSAHRQQQERCYLKGSNRARLVGLVLAFLSVLVVCGVGAYAIKLGHAKEGSGIIVGVVVSLAGTFIWGRTRVQRENRE